MWSRSLRNKKKEEGFTGAQQVYDCALDLLSYRDYSHKDMVERLQRKGATKAQALEAVAKRYLKDPQQWREIGTINQIAHPTRLSLGSVIVIPARLVGYQNVTIEHIQGNAETRSPVTGNNWKALGKGELNPMTAVITGRLKVSDMGLAMSLQPQMQALFSKLG